MEKTKIIENEKPNNFLKLVSQDIQKTNLIQQIRQLNKSKDIIDFLEDIVTSVDDDLEVVEFEQSVDILYQDHLLATLFEPGVEDDVIE